MNRLVSLLLDPLGLQLGFSFVFVFKQSPQFPCPAARFLVVCHKARHFVVLLRLEGLNPEPPPSFAPAFPSYSTPGDAMPLAMLKHAWAASFCWASRSELRTTDYRSLPHTGLRAASNWKVPALGTFTKHTSGICWQSPPLHPSTCSSPTQHSATSKSPTK